MKNNKPDTEKNISKNYYETLRNIKCDTAKRANLTYISWATAWDALKILYPDSTFEVHESPYGMPYFQDSSGAFVKVTVKVNKISHTVFLPVMDHSNNAMKKESYVIKRWDKWNKKDIETKVAAFTAFDVNKTIQRALTKGIALHGLGIYVYQGEDLPEESRNAEPDNVPESKPEPKTETVSDDKKPFVFRCEECKAEVSEKVYVWSGTHLDKHLCFTCQEKMKKAKNGGS